jgi:hypothetical protein
MNKLIVTTVAIAGLSLSAFAQQFTVDNSQNANTSPTATANGQFFIDINGAGVGTAVQLDPSGTYGGASAAGLNLAIYAGSSEANALSGGPLFTYNDVNALTGIALGQYFDAALGAIYTAPGVAPGANATIVVQAWLGNSLSWAGATGDYRTGGADGLTDGAHGQGYFTFLNPTGNQNSIPAGTPTTLTGMPGVILAPVPEPSTFALAGLGLASLVIFRRRK